MHPLTSDMACENQRPYFLWDEDTTIAEFRARLATAGPAERLRLIGKLMREARDSDVWLFVTPNEVWSQFPSLVPYLGRRLRFWRYLLGSWQRDGLVG